MAGDPTMLKKAIFQVSFWGLHLVGVRLTSH